MHAILSGWTLVCIIYYHVKNTHGIVRTAFQAEVAEALKTHDTNTTMPAVSSVWKAKNMAEAAANNMEVDKSLIRPMCTSIKRALSTLPGKLDAIWYQQRMVKRKTRKD